MGLLATSPPVSAQGRFPGAQSPGTGLADRPPGYTGIRATALAAAILLFAQPAAAFCLCLKCATGQFRSLEPVAGSMKPAVEPGACVIVEMGAAVDRGSIIAFHHPVQTQVTWIKRLIGLPGDTVEMRAGQVILNGTPLTLTPSGAYAQINRPEGPSASVPRCSAPVEMGETCQIPRLSEAMPDGTTHDILNIEDAGQFDTTAVFTVPPDHVFVLGDNRDNSTDSRIPVERGGLGFIPATSILGPVVEVANP